MSSSQLYRVNERATNELPPYPNVANDPFAHTVAPWGFEEPVTGKLPVREPAGKWMQDEQYAVMRTQSPTSLITPTTLLIAAAAYLLFLPTLA